MKTTITLLALVLVSALTAQVPQGINYQCVLRDGSGSLLTNANVDIRFTIHKSTAGGAVVYSEEHQLTSSGHGLVTAVIGSGSILNGTFSAIDWIGDDFFLQTEADDGTSGFVDLGTTQFVSVPYALASDKARTATDMQLNDLIDVNAAPDTSDVLKWNGTTWVSAADSEGELVLPYADTMALSGTSFGIVNTGSNSSAIWGTGFNGVVGVSNSTAGAGGHFSSPPGGTALFAPYGNLVVWDFAQLGVTAPAIRMKKLTGTTAATQGGQVTIAHGLDASKILDVTVLVRGATQSYVPPSFITSSNFEFNYFFDGANFYITNVSGNSAALLSKPISLLITYQE